MKTLIFQINNGDQNIALAERTAIVSGAITPQDANAGSKDHGVVFTFNKVFATVPDPNANTQLEISELTPEIFLNTIIENTELPASDSDRFFHVIGGYFINYEGSGNSRVVRTTQVFGVALEDRFGIVEGGTNILVDKWKLLEKGRKLVDMDERAKGPENEIGWTLIVEEAKLPRNKYPFSGKPIRFIQECADILGLNSEKIAETVSEITYRFTAEVDGPAPKQFEWDFGDGTQDTTEVNVVEHSYSRTSSPQTMTVTVNSIGVGKCGDETTTEVPVDPIPCPEVTGIDAVEGEKKENSLKYTFTAQLSGGTADEYQWDFGDGSTKTTKNPRATNTYTRPTEGDATFTVTVNTTGPENCTGSGQTTVEVPVQCPQLGAINANLLELSDNQAEYEFEVIFTGVKPDSFSWDFGDGTNTTTSENKVKHVYARPVGDEVSFEVKVSSAGPDECVGSTEVSVPVPGICPDNFSINAQPSTPTETEMEVQFTATFDGPAPTSFVWNFGDNSPEVTTSEPTVTHAFKRPDGDAETFTITVNTSGPGSSCSGSASVDQDIPGVCPVILRIDKEEELTETQLKVTFTAVFEGPKPDVFKWKLDDETTRNTASNTISHTYTRPGGNAISVLVTVESEGPGSCKASSETNVEVRGVCPAIATFTAEKGTITETTVEVIFSATFDGPTPESFTWNFGDGSQPVNTQVPQVTHIYQRPGEEKVTFTTQLSSTGPGECQASAEVDVEISPKCPAIIRIDHEKGVLTDTKVPVTFTAVIQGPRPENLTWKFGDGEEVSTSDLTVTHEYDRPAGNNQTFFVTLETSGPENCAAQASTDVDIDGICPSIIKVVASPAEPSETHLEVSFEVEFEGPAPESYTWSFGDNSPAVTTTEPRVSHLYALPVGESASFTVQVNSSGPGDCRSSGSVEVPVPGRCAILLGIDQQHGTPTRTKYPVTFTAKVKGPEPESFHWDFGDETLRTTTTREVTHEYNRPQDKDTTFAVTLDTSGPANCQAQTGIEVFVETPCPLILEIRKEVIEISDSQFEVEFTAVIEGNTPDNFIWDFGDGTGTQNSTGTSIRHIYERPDGQSESYHVTLNASGPKDCQASSTTVIRVPGECPVVVDILKIKETLTETHLNLQLRAIVAPEGTEPDVYIWDFGDERPPVQSAVPEVSVSYERSYEPQIATITVRTEGPTPGEGANPCESQMEIACPIPIIECPNVLGIDVQKGNATETHQTFTFTAKIGLGREPEKYKWDFGDGSPVVETLAKTIEHNYARLAGQNATYAVKLDTEGPQACKGTTGVTVEVDKVCPIFVSVDVKEELTDDKLIVTLTPAISGPLPDGYIVDWGDGSILPTVLVQPPLVHEYDRLPGKEATYNIRLTASGPGDCSSEWYRVVRVPGVCPKIIRVEQTVVKETEFVYGVKFEVFWEGPKPKTFIMGFGMISMPVVSEKPVIFHNFTRYSGKDYEAKGRLLIQGPGNCKAETEVVVRVPKSCPKLTGLKYERISSDRVSQTFNFEVDVEGYPPEKFIWDFGDGKRKRESKAPSYTYTFDRPVGSPKTFNVKVNGAGPQDCLTETETEVPVPPRCPELLAVTAKADVPGEKDFTVTFKAVTEKGRPERYTWDFGDGSPVQTVNTPEVSHTYQRPIGKDVVYTITVRIDGPEDCWSNGEVTCPVPGRCPEITGLESKMEPPQRKTQKVFFTATYKDIKPNLFVWNFGDGSPEKKTDTPHTDHTYSRPVGAPAKYKAVVKGQGPDDCGTSGDTWILVDEICPEIKGISTKVKPPTPTQLEVSFTALVEDPIPQEFIWNFGDGSPEKKSTSPKITHVFTRPAGDAETYTVTVTGKGPKDCLTRAEIACPIPGVCPVISDMDIQTKVYPDTFEVTLTPTITGPAPDGYTVDWGEGKAPTLALVQPPFTHTYQRPLGDDLSVNIKVVASGPDSCSSDWEGSVEIPGKCAVLTGIKQEVVKQDDFVYGIKFTAVWEGPQPTQFIIGFGMVVMPVVSKSPEIVLNFNRFGGLDQNLTGRMEIQGPGSCKSDMEIEVFVPGSCPRVTNLQKEILETNRSTQRIEFKAVVEGYPPEKFIWDFGDGKPTRESRSATYSHDYDRPEGADQEYVVTLTTMGPGECRHEQKITVEIPGICPEITGLKKVSETLTEKTKDVTYEVSFLDIQAKSYEWNWGDGSPKTTSKSPQASHSYEIKPGDKKLYTVEVTTSGPEPCKGHTTDEVEVPGVCPIILGVTVEMGNQSGDKQMVKATLQTEGPQAAKYVWNWGDGSPETTTTKPEAEHQYAILPGDDKTYSIYVDAQGPESCQASCAGEVEIPGVCPTLTSLDINLLPPEPESQEVEVTANIGGPMPDGFNWTWGDGTETATSIPTAKHTYTRLPGNPKPYFIEVRLIGPESCACEAGEEVMIPGICPEIEEVKTTKEEPKKRKILVKAEAVVKGPAPDEFEWDWGDGTLDKTDTNKSEHTYDQPIGDPKTYDIKVTAAGPEDCGASNQTLVELEGLCPVIVDGKLTYPTKDRVKQKVSLSLNMEDLLADTYTWDWGDGTPADKTDKPEAEHEYVRPFGEDKCYNIKVTAHGPCDCGSSYETQADIPGVCPEIENFSIQSVETKPDYEEIQLSFDLSVPEPKTIEIDWGDGSTPEKVDASPVSHQYTRLVGEDATYTIKADFIGPGTCHFSCDGVVTIKAKCPVVKGIDTVQLGSTDEYHKVKVSLEIADGTPDAYTWDWGDGSEPEKTELPEADHSYERFYGVDKSRTIQVSVSGPGNCTCNAATHVIVPGRCPELIHQKTIFGEWDPECQLVNIHFDVIGEKPENFIWDWGDGSQSTTTEARGSHTYARSPQDKEYMVTVTAKGPGKCEWESCMMIKVLGYCPKITEISRIYCGEGENYQEVQFTAYYRGKEPSEFLWDFGDGSKPERTKGNRHKHKFKQGKGEALEYLVSVTAFTFDDKEDDCHDVDCEDTGTLTIQIPGSCPAIIGMRAILGQADDNSQWIKWVVITRGPEPDSYEWNWGDGSATESSKEPFAEHLFAKGDDAAVSYQIKVKAVGPKSKKGGIDCATSYEATLEIKGEEVMTDC